MKLKVLSETETFSLQERPLRTIINKREARRQKQVRLHRSYMSCSTGPPLPGKHDHIRKRRLLKGVVEVRLNNEPAGQTVQFNKTNKKHVYTSSHCTPAGPVLHTTER